MSLKQRKQQDCQQYLDDLDNYQASIEEKEKALLSKLKKLVSDFQSERENLDKELSLDTLSEDMKLKKALINQKESLLSELQAKNKDIYWPFFVAALITMIVAYGLFGYNPENIMPGM